MSFTDILRAEFKLEYNDMLRRKSVLFMLIMYPYLFTLFALFIGYAGGSPEVFVEKFGLNPVLYLITSSYILMSILASVDVLLWRPLYDSENGTLVYIISSPVNRLKYYIALPFPRYTELLLMGATSILPVYVYYYGLEGVLLSLLVITLIAVGCVLMVPFAIFVAGVCHRVGESWRIINIVRPIVMILMGVYYPRFYIPLIGYVIGSLIPSSFIVEIIQRTLFHLESNTHLLLAIAFTLFFLYLPAGAWSIKAWEAKKVKEGVKIS